MAGPGDEVAAGTGGHGSLRASHADREQVIGTIRAAFVQGRLDKDEFDLRVGQTLAARTYAELAALGADLPAGLAAAQPAQPGRTPGKARVLTPGRVLTVATVVYAGVWPVALALPVSGPDHDPHAGVALAGTATLVYLLVFVGAVLQMLTEWLDRRSGRQPPRGPAPGAGGQASLRPPSGGPGGQLPQAGHGPRHTAEAAPGRGPRPPVAGAWGLQCCERPLR
jgi:hypothetical protein